MQEDSEIKAKKNEALKVTNKQKKLTPKQIINKALNKEKADKPNKINKILTNNLSEFHLVPQPQAKYII